MTRQQANLSAESIRAECASILATPEFRSSPVVSRLLNYLMEHELSGNPASLKAYAIAVEALGRDESFDPQIDSYPRVMVSRLRQMLNQHYLRSPGQIEMHIPVGQYGLRFRVNGDEETAIDAPEAPEQRPHPEKGYGRYMTAPVAVAIAFVMLIAFWFVRQSDVDRTWLQDDFPSITVSGTVRNGDEADQRRSTEVIMAAELARYESLLVENDPDSKSDFRLQVRDRRSNDRQIYNFTLTDERSGEIIWTARKETALADAENNEAREQLLGEIAFLIGQATGVLHAHERKKLVAPNSPYHCWLAFTEKWQGEFRIDDAALNDCTKDWHGARPGDTLASGLRVWSLLDQSITSPTASSRRALVNEAIGMAEQAARLNPHSSFAQLALMRAYAFGGRDARLRAVGQRALALNPHSLDIKGAVGMHLLLRNDPGGKALVVEAIDRHFNPPSWYHLGLYVDAMMHDDPGAARQALNAMPIINHSMPIVAMLRAAVEARTGNLVAARAAWAKARAVQPMLAINSDIMTDRLPLHPKIIARFRKWLAPAID